MLSSELSNLLALSHLRCLLSVICSYQALHLYLCNKLTNIPDGRDCLWFVQTKALSKCFGLLLSAGLYGDRYALACHDSRISTALPLHPSPFPPEFAGLMGLSASSACISPLLPQLDISISIAPHVTVYLPPFELPPDLPRNPGLMAGTGCRTGYC